MSRTVLSALGFALFATAAPLTTPAVAAEFTPESRVAEVTVYRQAALVAREARLTLPPGSHRIILKDLPCVADPDSVRVSGAGSAGIEIGGVEVQEEFRPPNLSPEYRQIEKELADLGREQSLIADRRQSIATLRDFLTGLKATGGQESSRDVLTKGFAVESWREAFDFFSSSLDGLSKEERALDEEQQDVAQRTVVARGRLSQMASQGGIRRWNAAVLVSSDRGGEMTLRVSYLATNATWQPLYDARLDPAIDRVSLSWMGQIQQTTGEDWKDVAVTLATARPSAGIDLPVLASLRLRSVTAQNGGKRGGFVGIVDGTDVDTLGRSYEDVLKLAPGISDASGDGIINMESVGEIDVTTAGAGAAYGRIETAQAQAARREVAVTFSLPGRMDIPSDGQAHKHLIAMREMEARVEHRAVPQLAQAVFLVATVTLPGEIPLLPGKVQHFVGGDLVGGSFMAERAAGEEFALSFGPDDRLKAERKQIQKRVERRGKDDEIAYRFVTTLENHLGRDGVVEVKDRIPVSGDDRIVVTLDDETTPGALSDEKEPGILTWKVPIPKGGKREIVLIYRVRSPRTVVMAGLD